MVSLLALAYAAMVGVWFAAASVGGSSMWMRWVCLAAALATAVVARFTLPGRVRPPKALFWLSLLVLYGILLSSASKSSGLAAAKSIVFAATTFACLLGTAALVEGFGRERLISVWRILWRALLVWSVVMVPLGRWRSGGEGLYGPTGNPNQYATILLSLGLVLCLPDARRGVGTLWKAEAIVGSALLLLTRSRATLAGVAVGCVVALLAGSGRRRWLLSGALLLLAGVTFVALPDSSVRQAESVAEGSTIKEMMQTREHTWEVSWDAMLAGLPFGFGWGVKEHTPKVWEFDTQSLYYGREEGTSWLPVGEELGLPGLFLVAALWVSLLVGAAGQPTRPRLAALAGLAAYFVLASFEGWFLTPGNWESMGFWTSMGILLARPREAAAPSPPVPSSAERPSLERIAS